MATYLHGLMESKSSKDDEGYVTYTCDFLVESDDPWDQAETIRQTAGLPLVGDLYIIGNDVNVSAWRKASDNIEPYQGKAGDTLWWKVTLTFSNKPPDKNKERCQDTTVDDPLLEPPKINQSGRDFHQEATRDRFGKPIVNSAHEQIRGPQVEFDDSRDTISLEYNVPAVDRALISALRNTLNRDTLWGFPPRCVKLSKADVENRYKGTCQIYYTLKLVFETNVIVDETTGAIRSGWDRDLLDEGTKVLNGFWDTDGTWQLSQINGIDPNPKNPTHFIRFKDRNGENARVILNGGGLPALVTAGLGNYFISRVGGNVGNPVSDSDSWIPLSIELLDEIDNPWIWISGNPYKAGQLVAYSGGVYLALADIPSRLRSFSPDTLFEWLELPGGATNEGLYNTATSYALGAVAEDSEDTSPGNIHVEKYRDANHLLLDIPVNLP